ncbi:HAMP domain-containing protein [Myxococcota bacterium]|nr:HAMP domain-containing protein [Myxococcota bacterium]MBU1379845.1 HAMP domain-containing protein [Myxococcota bacterium]MBU1496494.1 HAMP domain-containing protein [Myxococcota bacterium]
MKLRNSISGKIGIALVMAALLPSILAVFLLFNLLSTHDQLVRGHLKNLSRNSGKILDSWKSLLLEKKRRLQIEARLVTVEFEKLSASGMIESEIFEILLEKYQNISIITLLEKSNASDIEDHWLIPEKGIIRPTIKSSSQRQILKKKDLRFVAMYFPVKAGTLRLIYAVSENELAQYKTLADIYAENEQMLSVYRGIRKYYWEFFFIALLLIGIVSYFSARQILKRIVRRISALTEASRTIARGDLETQVKVEGEDEISRLSEDFNNMVTELKHYRSKTRYFERMGAWQEVARNLAHEIKNPLTPILLAVEQIQEKVPGDNPSYERLVNTAAGIVKEEVETLRRLVEAFGNLARLPEKKSTNVIFTDFMEDLKNIANLTWSDTHFQFISEKIVDTIIFCDPMLLKRAFLNVLENAVHACELQDEKIITLNSFIHNDQVIVEISDNGTGLPDQEKIFEPYYTTKDKGTGLGLPLARKILLDIGGDLSAAPASIHASRLIFEIPLKSSEVT